MAMHLSLNGHVDPLMNVKLVGNQWTLILIESSQHMFHIVWTRTKYHDHVPSIYGALSFRKCLYEVTEHDILWPIQAFQRPPHGNSLEWIYTYNNKPMSQNSSFNKHNLGG